MSEFIVELKSIIAEKHLLNHPFYQAWNKGDLPIEAMHEYAKQYYHLEKNFPLFLSQMHSACGDQFDARQAITQNMHDEEAGTENHRELWLRYSEGIGVAREEVEASHALPGTRRTISTLKQLSKDYLKGVAALAAYESQIPEVAESKIDGLKKHYDVSDERTLKFFTVHGVVDKHHANTWWNIIEKHADTYEKKNAVRNALTQSRDALWSFLDGITREYMPAHAC